jgi:hypothetical protein
VTIDVFRTGAKSYGRNRLVDQARISVEDGLVGLTFTSNPEGANDSRFQASVAPDSFRDMAEAMMRANPTEAIKAFGAALEAGIPEPRKVWFPGIDKDNLE